MANRLNARDLALVATFAALIAVLGLPGQLTLLGNAVPVTAQTLGVMLAGSLLGARRGAAAVLVFLVLVLAGLPLLAGGRGGVVVLSRPSAGFLVGWVAGAWLIGRLVELGRRPSLARLVLANVAGGLGVVYAFGIPVQAAIASLSVPQAAAATLVFVPGDLGKAVIAAVVAGAVHRGYPVLLDDTRAGDVRAAGPEDRPHPAPR